MINLFYKALDIGKYYVSKTVTLKYRINFFLFS